MTKRGTDLGVAKDVFDRGPMPVPMLDRSAVAVSAQVATCGRPQRW
jgi:hypothetical protein